MITTLLAGDDPAAIARAADILRAGGLVAFPTETVYGLGADALSATAVAGIFAAKDRPADNPLIVHVADVAAARRLTRSFPALAERAAAAMWPGPLTLVLPRGEAVPDVITAGQDTVALRVPAHPVALALLRACGRPLAAPSANRSGRPSPTRAEHVLADLDGRVALILDGGPTLHGLESSVLDLTGPRPLLLRRGAATLEQLRELLGPVDALDESDAAALRRSPGLRHRHYAPRARVLLVAEGAGEAAVERALAAGERVALVCRREVETQALLLRLPGDLAAFGRELFAGLRALDAAGIERIVVEAVPEQGIGAAIMDRLRRAAAG
ncbi:L-threonylcarbamoyladenylate synthase [Nannocystis sp.]|uniref:L-threonylcarbamoyladenylate synthase n=1 Tax=Nannocystis sp. TaxID=1962667 RepID=UPI0025E471AA|nr:L-threonylcarbamoyladenylate synthase [Nannocystis sp.]MBK7828133.1 threonylcarbamoyl-AMP synthase [Nannocystis sp.]